MGRGFRLHLLRALRENASPARTALGFALGAFIGIVPSFLVGAPLSFFLAGRLGLNRAAGVAGAVVSMNPLTAPFLYSLSAWLGFEITGQAMEREVAGVLNYFREYAVPFLLGNALLALIVAVILGVAMFVFVSRVGGSRGLRALMVQPKRYRPRRPASDRPAEGSAEIRPLP